MQDLDRALRQRFYEGLAKALGGERRDATKEEI